MAGLLIEQHREQSKTQLAKSAGANANNVSTYNYTVYHKCE
jgi:hypothetical protein